MRLQSFAALLAAAATASAQSVSGKAYGFAAGVTGGEGEAVTPSTAEELAELLADDTPRVIYIDKEFDFTGDVKTGPGCDRKSCSASNGGQLYLGDLSCGGDDNVAVSSITYDAAGPEPLPVGSNKSIIGNGKAVLKGKGLSIKKGSSNVIVQGIEITNLNPGVVWGGDALELKGENDGVWIDHCKFSKVGRMFIVSHYDGSRLTISNSEFDGVTDTSASCNGNHYWTMMFYGEGDKVTLDRNHFHDVAGRAPKLGEPGTNGYFHATNNYFQNMKGHAFDAYQGANAIIEGNVFDGVDTPVTKEGAAVSTLFIPDENAAASCQSVLGRACEPNSATSSGDLPIMSDKSGLNALAEHKDNIITPVSANEVAALVMSNAGPANVGSGSGSAPAGGSESDDDATETTPTAPETTPETTPQTTPDAVPEATTPQTTPETAPEQEQSVPEVDRDEQVEPVAQAETKPAATGDCEEEAEESTPVVEQPTSESECEEEAAPSAKAEVKPVAKEDDYDSEDTPKASASESSSPATPSNGSSSSGSSSVQMYGQCGGKDFTGSTKCASGSTCKKVNEYYSQCLGSNSRVRRYVQV
ncbi:related to bromodomain protein BDF1 [Fusarium torulosum]|uniref:pectin lyase n=1 Tax=Fusarium torulosum TaxID=33205 RepID=A0AAE8SCL6_9HYPO|nr:related to bromodomain protein BDF1 [Fusarium torulosum]